MVRVECLHGTLILSVVMTSLFFTVSSGSRAVALTTSAYVVCKLAARSVRLISTSMLTLRSLRPTSASVDLQHLIVSALSWDCFNIVYHRFGFNICSFQFQYIYDHFNFSGFSISAYSHFSFTHGHLNLSLWSPQFQQVDTSAVAHACPLQLQHNIIISVINQFQ